MVRLLSCAVVITSVSACSDVATPVSSPEPSAWLSDEDAALRVSMALRGVRTVAAETEGQELETLATEWAASQEFLQTVHDLHLEGWWLAVEEFGAPPAYGALEGYTQHEIRAAMFEEVPRLVADLVAHRGA